MTASANSSSARESASGLRSRLKRFVLILALAIIAGLLGDALRDRRVFFPERGRPLILEVIPETP